MLKRKRTVVKLIVGLGILFVGLCLYVNERDNTYINIIFDNYLKLSKLSFTLPSFINNWGFDIIWSLSFALLLSCFVGNTYSTILAIAFSIIFELFQTIDPSLGTFDVLDIVFEIITIIFIAIINNFFERRFEK